MLGVFHDALFAVDEKTASQLGPSWTRQWELDSQFTGYCWAAQQFSYPVAGAIVRGISFLKNSFGHAQAIVYRPAWMLDRWYQNLIYDIQRMIDTYERFQNSALIPSALDKGVCSNYGGCAYYKLCTSPNPEAWVETEFAPRHWNPLAKGA
jgi:hypothetical protein